MHSLGIHSMSFVEFIDSLSLWLYPLKKDCLHLNMHLNMCLVFSFPNKICT